MPGPKTERAYSSKYDPEMKFPTTYARAISAILCHVRPADYPVLTLKHREEPLPQMVAPAQHEKHEEGHERTHQQHVIQRADIAVTLFRKRRVFLPDSHFLYSRRWKAEAEVVHCAFGAWLGEAAAAGGSWVLLHLKSFGHYEFVDLLLDALHLVGDVIDEFIHSPAVIRKFVRELDELAYIAQIPSDIARAARCSRR